MTGSGLPLGPGAVGRVVDPIVVQACWSRPILAGGQGTGGCGSPALGQGFFGRANVPELVIQVADGGVHTRGDRGSDSVDDAFDPARLNSQSACQRRRWISEGDQGLESAPGAGGVPPDDALFQHRRGHG